jgi:bifunctional non-homologous end joining protein LigD
MSNFVGPPAKPGGFLFLAKQPPSAGNRACSTFPAMPTARFKSRRDFPPPPTKPRAAPARRKKAVDIATITGAKPGPMPGVITPQLATLVKAPPAGTTWVHEVKYDGYRMLCRIDDRDARIVSRNGKEWTEDFPSVAKAAALLPVRNAWLDGEICVVDAKGRSSFQALQNVLSKAPGTLVYFAFDLLYVDGMDLRDCALVDRKAVLEKLLAGAAATIVYSDHFAAPGADFYANVCKLGLEGIVSKRANGTFQSGRSSAWLKVKCTRRQEFVIGGYTDPEGNRVGLGALLLGVYEPDGRLTFCGRVGTGFNDKSLADLSRRLRPLEHKAPAFHNPPRGADARGVHWVAPVLVAEVAFTEWTNEGTLRHPSFQGLREDKPAREVVREYLATEGE